MRNENIKGMIFAAGLGTRLYPLTADKPKALVQINEVPLLAMAINKLIAAGITDIVVNVHHFSQLIIDYLKNHTFEANIFISDESSMLLDTAGGLKKAEPFFHQAEHVLLYNVDIISTIDLQKMMQFHRIKKPLATLAVKNRATTRYFIFDSLSNQLSGWYHTQRQEKIITRHTNHEELLGFSGIHLVRKDMFNFLQNDYPQSLTAVYLSLSAQYTILGYPHHEDEWCDVGKYDDVIQNAAAFTLQ